MAQTEPIDCCAISLLGPARIAVHNHILPSENEQTLMFIQSCYGAHLLQSKQEEGGVRDRCNDNNVRPQLPEGKRRWRTYQDVGAAP